MMQTNISTKQKQTHKCRDQTWGGRGEKEWEFGISRHKLLYRGWINKKVLLYGTGNYVQHSVTNHNVNEYEKEYIIYICITESLCCTEEINTTL